MSVLVNLVRRNNKLFFRDKASLFFSLLSALIVLGLYLLFLRRLNVASLEQAIGDAAYNVIDSWMFSGILAIITVSSTLGAFGTMVDDRYRKISRDFLASPVRRSSLTAGYILTSVIIGIVLFLIALGLCQIYMAGNGFLLLSPLEFLKLLGVLIITVFSSSALMFFLISFIKTLNAYSTASAIIGTLIGFVTGVYMPIGMFPESVQTVIKLIPPSHGAMLMRQIMTSRPIEAGFVGAPAEALAEFRTQMGIDFVVGGEILPAWISILFLLAAGFLFFCLGLLKMRQKEK
ncbi:MAG: ABC transporter permease [Christensenellales bacterium]|jgi:multidrug/hemolysin transport system permease protein